MYVQDEKGLTGPAFTYLSGDTTLDRKYKGRVCSKKTAVVRPTHGGGALLGREKSEHRLCTKLQNMAKRKLKSQK